MKSELLNSVRDLCSPSVILPADQDNDIRTAYQWLLEAWLVRVRWWALILGALFVPLLPATRRPWAILLLMGLALGNAWMRNIIGRTLDSQRLGTTRKLATPFDWLLALAGMALSAGSPIHSLLSAVVLLLIMLTGLRLGLVGLLAGTLTASLVGGTLLAMHTEFNAFGMATAVELPTGWLILVVLTTLIGVGFNRTLAASFQLHKNQVASQDAAVRRLKFRLSDRECELLP